MTDPLFPTSAPRLALAGIHKAFGATQALRDVSLEVAAGEVHAIVGENGAGKTTLMNILGGTLAPDAGSMHLDGAPYRPHDTLDARKHGVAMIHQELSLAPHLSAWENIMLGAEPQRVGWLRRDAAKEAARAALARLGHPDFPLDRAAGSCSIAEQQILEIARALRTEPRVLIMDEPTSSLAQADVERLFAVIRQLKQRGVSVIYISHFLEEVKRIGDRFTVIKDGQTVGTGPLGEIPQSRLVRMMVGREVAELYPRRVPRSGETILRVAGLSAGPRLARADFTLAKGEILGIAGLIGAGRTELVRAVFGLDACDDGVVTLEGSPPLRTTRANWRAGLGFLSENRKEEGLMLGLSIAENTALPKMAQFGRSGWLNRGRMETAVNRWISQLGIKARDPRQPVGELSGGSQQKVALARLLEYPARLFLLDEPTRGIDVGSKAQIYELIAGLASEGRSVVLVSSYLPELFGMCDRIAVMRRGELVECRPAKDWTEATLMTAAIGSVN
ncbi:MAG: Ribose transport system, ATP-binding protein RbsA [Verrucomicrobia bacterium]|nr:Ribose transport system, ATP-binding protein RbsA [Verrucomicrobiota bacterium]